MHPQAFEFVGRFATEEHLTVIEIGSRQVNLDNTGVIRSHFPKSTWVGLDLHAGRGVDVLCNAEHYKPEALVDLVICCEVLEHSPRWRQLIQTAATWLKPNGRIIITCAGLGRPTHSHHDGGELRPGEYYGNLAASAVRQQLELAGLREIEAAESGHDTYATALR